MKTLLTLLLMVITKVLGDVCLSHGMHQVGHLELHPLKLLMLGLQMVLNPWFDLGTSLELTFLLLYLFALARLDLSYLLPITASNYLLTTLVAGFFLHENINLNRWLGIGAISIGVLLVGLSERHKIAGPPEQT